MQKIQKNQNNMQCFTFTPVTQEDDFQLQNKQYNNKSPQNLKIKVQKAH